MITVRYKNFTGVFLFCRGRIGYLIASTASHEIAIQGYVWENVDFWMQKTLYK